MHYAAENGHLKTCELLIQRNANLNIKDKEGHMPIELACKKGHFEVGTLQLNEMINSEGASVLREAVLKGDLKVFDTMMKFESLNLCQILFDSLNVNTAINIFSLSYHAHPNYKMLKSFINDANLLIGQDEWKLLHHGVRIGIPEICEIIIRYTKDKNPKGKGGLTPYHCAAWSGNLEMCQVIARNIDEKNPVDDFGRTPLYYAERNGYSQVAEFLSLTSKNDVDKFRKGKESIYCTRVIIARS